jgi:hypothetical protein
MKLDNYKTIKKTEWQELAKSFGISYEENSVVRYLVEKIAEKVGVDDKIVSDNELKKQVIEKINSDSQNVPVEETAQPKTKKVTAKKVTAKKVTTKKVSKPKEVIIAKVEVPVVEVPVVEVPVVELTRLEQLRKECESYGIAWAENHQEANLEQVLNGVKSAGVLPISEQPKINTNESFEINSVNADEVALAVQNAPQPTFTSTQDPAYNPLSVPPVPPVNGGYTTSNSYLDTYKNIYLNAIRGHWRLLSIADINEMISRDTQTFTYQVNVNPQQNNKVEIWLTQGSASVRIPSANTNEWIDING